MDFRWRNLQRGAQREGIGAAQGRAALKAGDCIREGGILIQEVADAECDAGPLPEAAQDPVPELVAGIQVQRGVGSDLESSVARGLHASYAGNPRRGVPAAVIPEKHAL